MITIIHGDDVVSSRKYLQEQKQKIDDPYVFDGDIDLLSIVQITQGGGLFESSKKIFVESFFSKNKLNNSASLDIINYINKNESLFDIFFWEGKELQKKSLSVFSKTAVKIFKIPQTIFLFLDNIMPNNYKKNIILFHNALENADDQMLFFMMQRQFRLLLAISDKNAKEAIDEILRLAPWQKSKLERQSKLFSIDKLVLIYKQLLSIDISQKTGNLPFSLICAIDFLLLSI